MIINKEEIIAPYYILEELPSLDFNREIHKPGENEDYPEGVVGIRTDSDFWCVAALPYKYIEISLEEIVNSLWPEYKDIASYAPDAGTIEQKVYFANQWAKSQQENIDFLSKKVRELEDLISRLRAKRYDLHEIHSFKNKRQNRYFLAQYEHLITAMAHIFKSTQEPGFAGICSVCGLLSSNRVHQEKYIKLHDEGYSSDFLFLK